MVVSTQTRGLEQTPDAPSENMNSFVVLLAIIILGLILRIPRVSGLVGADSFRVLWMGRIISEGYFANWFISPFSLIGYYPFASYPIGGPLIVGLFLNLGFSLETTVLLISAIVTITGTVGAYGLGRELFEGESSILLFTAFYSLSNIFVRFTYFSLSVRGLYLTVLPWLLLYSVRLFRNRRLKDGFITLCLLLVLFLTHALAAYTLLYLLAVGLWCLADSINRFVKQSTHVGSVLLIRGFARLDRLSVESRTVRRLNGLMPTLLYVVSALVSLIGGVLVLGIDPRKTTEFLMSNATMFGLLSNLVVDYFLRLGLISIFLPLGALIAFRKAHNFKGKSIHFIVTIIVCFSLAMSLYASVIFLPIFGYYSVVGFSFLWHSVNRKRILLLTIALALSVSLGYPAFMGTTSLHSVLMSVALAVILLVAVIPSNMFPSILNIKSKYIYILLLSMMIVTAMSIDGPLNYNPYGYISNDEKAIIHYLDENSEGGISFVFKPEIGARLESYGHITIRSYNEDKSLYMNWITPEEIRENTEIDFSLERILMTGRFLYYNGTLPEKDLWNRLKSLDLTVESNLVAAKELGLRYVVVEKSVGGWQSYVRTTYGDTFSQLLYTTPYACSIAYDGDRMTLFALP